MTNRSIDRYPEVIAYMDRVCSEVKSKELHEEIRLEVLGHLEELAIEKAAESNLSEEEAIASALQQMGDPVEIGRQLHHAHKPKMEWGIIGLVASMILIALISLFSNQLSQSGHDPKVTGIILDRKLISGVAGIAALTALYFLNYRKLLRYSWMLFGMTLLLMAAVQIQGNHINGASYWLQFGGFSFNVYAISPYLLIIAAAGMLHVRKPAPAQLHKKLLTVTKETAIYMLLPACFYILAPAIAYYVIYCLGLGILLIARRQKPLLAGLAIFNLLLFLIPLAIGRSLDSAWKRLTAFLHPEAMADYGGYMTYQSVEAIRTGGMWGQGFGTTYSKLPYMSSDLVFSSLVYSLGWVFGLVVATIALMFTVKAARLGTKLRDGYAKDLVVGLSAVLGIQLMWNLLMCLGLLPILDISLPIMNWSSGTIIELAAVGIMLSAYRRKNMVKHSVLHVS